MQEVSILSSIGFMLYHKLRWIFEYLQELKEENILVYLANEADPAYVQEYDFF